MPRATLVIVPDEGAAEMVRGALVEAGIQPEFARARPEHPYRPSVLAEPWCVLVPEDRLADGRNALARLEHDLAEEADAQSRAWDGRPDPDEAEPPPTRDVDALPATHVPRVLWALALAFVLPFPAVTFYARARRLGAVFLGLFLASVGLALTQGIWTIGLDGLVLLDDASAERRAAVGGGENEGSHDNVVPSEGAEPESLPRPTVAPGEVILEGIDVAGPQEPPDQGDEVAPLALLGSLATVDWIVLLGLATKIADLLAGLVVIGLDRRRAFAQPSPNAQSMSS